MTEWTAELTHSDEDITIGHAGPVVVHFWHRHVTVEALARLQAALLARADERALYTMSVVEATASIPEQPARDAGASVLDAVTSRIRASALILEGAAMQSAAFRGIDAGLSVLARRDHPHRAFPSVGEASLWLAGQMGQGARGDELEAIVDDLRRLTPQ